MATTSTTSVSERFTRDELSSVYRKVTWRIIPFLFICYVFAYLDRVNIGFAALQMKQDLNFSDAVYGLGAGMFFVGYFLFEVPSNLLLEKIGARKTLMRIMVVWGLISGSFPFIHTPVQFYIARFLLGAFEAGFFPGVVLYLTYWYPGAMRGKIIAIFMSAIAVAGIIGGPLSGWVMGHMNGVYGWEGWQWMFAIEAVPSVVLGLLTIVALADKPQHAKWLTHREQQMVIESIATTSADAEHSFTMALRDPRLYVMSFVYFTIAAGIYVISFWLPTMIRNYGVNDPVQIGILTAIPYIVGAVGMVLISKNSDKTGERRWHTALCMLGGGVGLVAATFVPGNLTLALCALSLATTCILTTMPVFWTIPTSYLSGTAAAGGVALINSIGLLGGFVSPSVIGWLKTVTGSLTYGLYTFSTVLTVGAVVLLAGMPARLLRKR
ncbi:MFS transporter [Paraburkholderia ginsengiterrae]|uniref:MFS transporter n=1 Tax=Paraburkholderia ginsengiterrae TaxID=1462993 RepID=A0A1A9N275_9BURK|nr:MFS transporter [Paraburkholderia ginsengiterrae]OAJ58613.1 MFS transporter [Paraburkholderia ginsengiterrae]